MKNNQNTKIQGIPKLVKIEKCECGKLFDFPKWTVIYTCQDCLKMMMKTVSQNNPDLTENNQNLNHSKYDKCHEK